VLPKSLSLFRRISVIKLSSGTLGFC